MSKYTFIISDSELPEIDLTNETTITIEQAKSKGVRPPNWCSWDELSPNLEISYFENEDDAQNLCIRKDYDFVDELKLYTNKKYIYMIYGSSDIKRAEQLLNYILNLKSNNQIEIYSIWAGDNAKITPCSISLENLNKDIILDTIDNFNKALIIN